MGEMKTNLLTFEGVKRCKSIWRAQKRGVASPEGVVYPRRPFNNRKNKPYQDLKRLIYGGYKLHRNYSG